MPFGEGPRKCIGNNFAMLEVLILTTMFSKEFNIHIENIFVLKVVNCCCYYHLENDCSLSV